MSIGGRRKLDLEVAKGFRQIIKICVIDCWSTNVEAS